MIVRIRQHAIASLLAGTSLFAASGVWASIQGSHAQTSGGQSAPRLNMQASPCAQQDSGVLGTIGRLAPGHSVAELNRAGVSVDPLANTAANVDRNGRGVSQVAADSLVLLTHTGKSGPAGFESVHANAALQSAADVRFQSRDPSLQSCDRQLADSPAALRLAKLGGAAMIAAGLLTQQQFDAVSTTYFVSDDPMNASNVFVTVVLARAIPQVTGRPTAAPPASQLLTPVLATVDRGTGVATVLGYANWYAGQ